MSREAQSNIPVEAIRKASRSPEVQREMAAFYARLDARLAELPGTCWNRAECCHFATYDHRLYVTTLEAAYYLAQRPEVAAALGDACPHAREQRCHARAPRPMGCRIFLCDEQAREWQGPVTEAGLRELRDLHEQLHVPYTYADWMVVLRALEGGSAAQPSQNDTTSEAPHETTERDVALRVLPHSDNSQRRA